MCIDTPYIHTSNIHHIYILRRYTICTLRLALGVLRTMCMVIAIVCKWHYVWWCDTVWRCDTMYGDVTLCMMMWHYVWRCDTMYDDVTLCMMMWHCVWWCDTMYGDSVGLQEQVGEYIWCIYAVCIYGVCSKYVYMVYLCTYGDSVGLQVYTWYIYRRYIKYIIYYYIISVGW